MPVTKAWLAYYASLNSSETATKLVRELREHGQEVHDGTLGFNASIDRRRSQYSLFAGSIVVSEPIVARVESRWLGLLEAQSDVRRGVAPIRDAKRSFKEDVDSHQAIFAYLESEGKLTNGDLALAKRIQRVGRMTYISAVLIDGQLTDLVGATRMQSLVTPYNDWSKDPRSKNIERLRALRSSARDIENFITVLAPDLSGDNVQKAEDMMGELNDLYDDVHE
jgi:hypothetical protein